MFKNMIPEASMGCKFHAAIWEGADKWSLFGMRAPDVVLQSIITLKSFEAVVILADERSRFGMSSSMTNNFGFISEKFATALVSANIFFTVFFTHELIERLGVFIVIVSEVVGMVVKHFK
jgi:hypothetical protein